MEPHSFYNIPEFKQHLSSELVHQVDMKDTTFQNLLKALNETSIMAFTDTNGTITYVNDKFCEISEYSREELIGKNHRILKSGYHSPQFYKTIWDTISSGLVWTGEIKNRTKSGRFYWVFTTIIPFLDVDKVPYQYAAIRIDITQKKKMEEDRDKALSEKMQAEIQQAAYEKFVSTLVHDLRNPLMVASVSAEMIQKRNCPPDKVMDLASRIQKKLEQADIMIKSVLEESRKKGGITFSLVITEFDVNEIAGQVLDDLSLIYGDRFNFSCEKPLLGHWSKSAVRRILENLCTNAIKYGDQKSKVTVSLATISGGLEISVHNFGNPIPNKELSSLFNYFHRSQTAEISEQHGWGIGLAVVHGMAKALGGLVSAESSLDAGTTFIVKIPLDARPFQLPTNIKGE